MIPFLTTTDAVKLSAAEALLRNAGIDSAVFDRAAGALWTAIIPMRLMIEDGTLASARQAMCAAAWKSAADGDWDFFGR